MTLYQIHGFQSGNAPHWSVAFVEADTPDQARAVLYAKLTNRLQELPDTVWGWDESYPEESYQDLDTWRVDEWKTPVLFVLGGGCR